MSLESEGIPRMKKKKPVAAPAVASSGPINIGLAAMGIVRACQERDDTIFGHYLEMLKVGQFGIDPEFLRQMIVQALFSKEREMVSMSSPTAHQSYRDESEPTRLRYIEMRKQAKAALGDHFDRVYTESKKVAIECDTANGCEIKPAFDDDGRPVGSE